MSGICGAIGVDGQPFDHRDLAGMITVLAPLGTQGPSYWSGDAGRCGVAVAVIPSRRRGRAPPGDESSDHSATIGPAGNSVIVGDIRLDNRDELLAALHMPFATLDDQLALAAYERWGQGCLQRLIGSYALAIVDRRGGGVLLARDHVGDRPLVVHQRRHVVAFASNALALTGFAGVGHDLDEHKAAQILAASYGTDRTLVAGVRWLPPGHAMWVDAEGPRTWRWWLTDPDGIADLGSLDAHAEALRIAFDAAVAACRRGAGQIGAQLSGGLDSTSVAATAAGQLHPTSLPVYTAVPPPAWTGPTRPGWDADESALVKDLVARHPNLVPTWVTARHGRLFDGAETLWELGAVPPRNPANTLWTEAIDRVAAADGVDVLLTGEHGNLAFSADGPGWLTALVGAGRPVIAARQARAWSGATGRPLPTVVRTGLVGPLMPPALRRARRRWRGDPDPVSAWLATSSLRAELVDLVELPSTRPGLDDHRRVSHRAALWAELTGLAGQAETTAAVAATSGVEHRDPTAARPVLEVAATQPEWTRRAGGHGRAAVRAAMASRLPPSIAWRRRRGAQLPEWLDRLTVARPELAEGVTAMHDHPTSRRLIDVERLDRLVEEWPHAGDAADPVVDRDYRMALLRGVALSRYFRWFEDRAREQRSHPTTERDAGRPPRPEARR